MNRTDRCFHCAEPLLGSTLTVRIRGLDQPVCCTGCLAVAELIATCGLTDYYRFRDESAPKPSPAEDADAWSPLSRADVAAQFIRRTGEDDTVTFAVDGLRCGACGWLIDRVLKSRSGVRDATTNVATGRTQVRWDPARISLGDVARSIAQLGYRPHPLDSRAAQDPSRAERRDAMKRLAVAGLGMMQVMSFAAADYAASLSGERIDAGLLAFFRATSLLIATPVVFYAAAPIFAGALRSVQSRVIGMDVPVAIALALAYGASVWNTLVTRNGTVYFDSVTMFVFFLTFSRFVQMTVRHRTTDITDALARQLPAYARRIEADGLRDVPIAALSADDELLVRGGEVIPADGDLADDEALVGEALLTGEAAAVRKHKGDRLLAGSLNAGEAFRFTVTASANATTLAHIVSLIREGQTQRPANGGLAERSAARFLRYVLIGAGATAAVWWVLDPTRAFEITLSVLVVACPCAFAIAMPAATAAATAHLARFGLLVVRIDALEALARIDKIVFDKTGTLTRGDIAIRHCTTVGALDLDECSKIAAALELASTHPIARAFAHIRPPRLATEVRLVPGNGLEGTVDGRRYRIGSPEFVASMRGASASTSVEAHTIVVLGDAAQELARFELEDEVRPSAAPALQSLTSLRIGAQILSGDSDDAVAAIAADCGISDCSSRQTPEQKVERLRRAQAEGQCVAMVGDGINDAPVLATADVSIAMGRGAALAHASADMVLVTEDLRSLPAAVRLARRAQRIARQNLTWSAIYNFGSLPLAALGLIPPWLAALGMSLSSMAVMLNAARLLPPRERRVLARNRAQPPAAPARSSIASQGTGA